MAVTQILCVALVLSQVSYCSCSEGDRSPFYQNCVKSCKKSNCTKDGEHYTVESSNSQELWSRLLLWSCAGDCRYHCMWKTVDAFVDRNYDVPKFHGKWPFKRLLGIQEPASAFASVLNLLGFVYMHLQLRQQFPAGKAPMVLFWHAYTAVGANAWVWSTIFHARDTPFTEFMDYACALSLVTGNLVAAIVRILHRRRRLTGALSAALLVHFASHVRYLWAGRIDYSYNMSVNVALGAAGAAAWLGWAAARRGAGRVAAAAAAGSAAAALELLDFPPRAGWDAHALWHLATAPLPLLFCRFVADDLRRLQAAALPTTKLDYKTT